MNRLPAAIGIAWVALILLAACAGGAGEAVKPAPDQPTFVWIFSDP